MSWKDKLPLEAIMRLLQVLVPQVEKICIDRCVWLSQWVPQNSLLGVVCACSRVAVGAGEQPV